MGTRPFRDQFVDNSRELTELRRQIGMVVGILTDHLTIDDLNKLIKEKRPELPAVELRWQGQDSKKRRIEWFMGIPVHQGQYSNHVGDLHISCRCLETGASLYLLSGQMTPGKILGPQMNIQLDSDHIRRVHDAVEILIKAMFRTFSALPFRAKYLLDESLLGS